MKKYKIKIKKEIEISLRCSCGDHQYLIFWKDNDFLPKEWAVSISRHYVPFRIRFKKALMLIFCPYRLNSWEEFLIKDKTMKQLASKINKFYEKR